MGWYDIFARFYDQSLEELYRDARVSAVAALDLEPGMRVLDVPCGTGLSLRGLVHHVGAHGVVVGLDRSYGMLAQAAQRARRNHWSNVILTHGDVCSDQLELAGAVAGGESDRLLIFLGLSAFTDWHEAFSRLWAQLRPGGRCVVVDVHAAKPGFQGHMLNLVARAEIRRRTWEPLEAVANDFRRVQLTARRAHGGQLFLATGVKP